MQSGGRQGAVGVFETRREGAVQGRCAQEKGRLEHMVVCAKGACGCWEMGQVVPVMCRGEGRGR